MSAQLKILLGASGGARALARINQGPIEKLVVYDPASSVKRHVYDKERCYALLVVDILYDLPTRDIVRLF